MTTNKLKPFPGDQRIFSISRAAHYLGISERTLRRMTAHGEIPSFDFHGRRMYHRVDIDRFIDKLKPWNDGPKAG